jgi:hypothetical protein
MHSRHLQQILGILYLFRTTNNGNYAVISAWYRLVDSDISARLFANLLNLRSLGSNNRTREL